MHTKDTSQTPTARRSQVVVSEMGQEVVLYDIIEDKVHSLNPTAALIWKQCDGSRTVADIARSLEQQFQAGNSEEIVWSALDQMQQQSLLTEKVARPSKSPSLSRRRMIGKAAAGALLALPLVTTLIAPTPVMAQSATTSAPTTGTPTTTLTPTTSTTTTLVPTTTTTTTTSTTTTMGPG